MSKFQVALGIVADTMQQIDVFGGNVSGGDFPQSQHGILILVPRDEFLGAFAELARPFTG